MRALLLLLALWFSPSILLCQEFTGFDDFLRRYRASPPAAQRELARAFVQQQQARGGFPIVEPDGEAVFMYLGTHLEKDVRLVGDFLPISPTNVYWDTAGVAMERVGSIFYQRRRFEPHHDQSSAVRGQALHPRHAHSRHRRAGPPRCGPLLRSPRGIRASSESRRTRSSTSGCAMPKIPESSEPREKAGRSYRLTKDSDFALLLQQHGPPPQVLWVTLGNTSNPRMRQVLLRTLRPALDLLRRGEPLVEISEPHS